MSFLTSNFLKNYKTIVSDFDGTLSDHTLAVTPQLKNFVRRMKNQGLHFSIATGRPFQGTIEKASKQLKLSDPQIVSGGSALISPLTGRPIWASYIQTSLVRTLVSFFLGLGATFTVERHDGVYSPGALPQEAHGPGVPHRDISLLTGDGVLKMVVFPVGMKQSILNQIEDVLETHKDKLHIIRAKTTKGDTVFDITSIIASKHYAILELTKLLSISPHETIGIGDGYNDYPLLSTCGYKIAIEGAPKELVGIADVVVSREKLLS